MIRFVHERWWKRKLPGHWEAHHPRHRNYKVVIVVRDDFGFVAVYRDEIIPGVHHIQKRLVEHTDPGTLWLHQLQELAIEMMQQEIIMREY